MGLGPPQHETGDPELHLQETAGASFPARGGSGVYGCKDTRVSAHPLGSLARPDRASGSHGRAAGGDPASTWTPLARPPAPPAPCMERPHVHREASACGRPTRLAARPPAPLLGPGGRWVGRAAAGSALGVSNPLGEDNSVTNFILLQDADSLRLENPRTGWGREAQGSTWLSGTRFRALTGCPGDSRSVSILAWRFNSTGRSGHFIPNGSEDSGSFEKEAAKKAERRLERRLLLLRAGGCPGGSGAGTRPTWSPPAPRRFWKADTWAVVTQLRRHCGEVGAAAPPPPRGPGPRGPSCGAADTAADQRGSDPDRSDGAAGSSHLAARAWTPCSSGLPEPRMLNRLGQSPSNGLQAVNSSSGK